MNIQKAREALLLFEPVTREQDKAREFLARFLYEVEELMKNNSIKQTPALFKPFEVKNG